MSDRRGGGRKRESLFDGRDESQRTIGPFPLPLRRQWAGRSLADFDQLGPDELRDVSNAAGGKFADAELHDLFEVLLKFIEGRGLRVGSRQAGHDADVKPGFPISLDHGREATSHDTSIPDAPVSRKDKAGSFPCRVPLRVFAAAAIFAVTLSGCAMLSPKGDAINGELTFSLQNSQLTIIAQAPAAAASASLPTQAYSGATTAASTIATTISPGGSRRAVQASLVRERLSPTIARERSFGGPGPGRRSANRRS